MNSERVYRGDEEDLEVAIRYSPRIARWIVERYGSARSMSSREEGARPVVRETRDDSQRRAND